MTRLWFLLLLLFVCPSRQSGNNNIIWDQELESELELPQINGLLYPRESETREVRTLDGIWNFVKSNVSDPMQGEREGWYRDDLSKNQRTIPMPVPASYNDITTQHELRDHVGTVWYERKFYVPRNWGFQRRIWLRFSSVHYAAIVWLNGAKILQHAIGHLPFEVEVTFHVKFGLENRLTVMCDNTLLPTTVPQGEVQQLPSDNGTTILQSYTFDFFNYAGIHRSVHLYTTPNVFIKDIILNTRVKYTTGYIMFHVTAEHDLLNNVLDESETHLSLHLLLRNKAGEQVANTTALYMLNGTLKVPEVQLWWPYLMHPEPAYLYTLELRLYSTSDLKLLDIYRLPVGIRTLSWSNSTFLLNDKPLYLRGFGRHEDSDIRGKGLDLALLTRNFNLLKWIGANAYRTSHYPYSEESMQFADEQGIMIIDECPSVNTDIFSADLLQNHKSALQQLIHRDRNHASVIMWSIANEPRSTHSKADEYFKKITEYTRRLDSTRPLTASINANRTLDKLAQFLDIISFNRYNAWYQNAGQLDMITSYITKEAFAWHELHQKPVLLSEYGGDTLTGFHKLPSFIWSEDYQAALFSKHFKAFDDLRQRGFFIGEFVWNFADFETEQTSTRAGGNKKGVFTRNRQPKAAAHLLRQRYFSLALLLDASAMPADLFPYIIDWSKGSTTPKPEL